MKDELYFIGGTNDSGKRIKYVDKYSLTSNKWSEVAQMHDNRTFFRSCFGSRNGFGI